LNYVHGFITNVSNNRTHLHFKKLHDSFHLNVPSTAQQIAVNYTASMLSSSSDDSGDERRWKICDKRTGGEFAWEQECKVLNCSTQEGTANPPSKKSVCCC
jgi:hypothetical protein